MRWLIGLIGLAGLVAQPGQAQQIDLRLTPRYEIGGITDIKHAGDGSNRLFLVRQAGEVRVVRGGELRPTSFLNIRGIVNASANEQGLLSIAFPPDFASSQRFYVYYIESDDDSVIARYRVSADPDVADADSGQVLFRQEQFATNHNGGRLEFGPDGMLYLGLGDGGGANDPQQTGQATNVLLGKIIRIDVSGDEADYAVPPDNPFLGQPPRDEIWASGLRNPWRISFDRLTGDLYSADVGQNQFEEVNFQAAGVAGLNYGWSVFEGNSCFAGQSSCAAASGLTAPAFEYDHGQGCSVTGGQVYRGQDYPNLYGMYLFGDFCSGRIWGMRRDGDNFVTTELLQAQTGFTTFGEDEVGNVYAAGANVALLSDGPPAPASRPLVGQHSGTYVVANMPDQGFFVNVGDSNGQPFLFFAWFTYRNGEPFWLVGNEIFNQGEAMVSMAVQELSGPNFLDFSNQTANRSDFGTIKFTARDCDILDAEYDFGNAGTGTLQLNRLTNTRGHACID